MNEEIKNIPLFIERNPKLVAKFKKEETFDTNCIRTTSSGKKEIFIPKKFEFFSKPIKPIKKVKTFKKEKEELEETIDLEYSIEKKMLDNEDYD